MNLDNFRVQYFSNFQFFYSVLGYRTFVTLFLGMFVALFDGFGLVMFLPLLQMVDGSNSITGEELGGLQFVLDFIVTLGIPMTLVGVLSVILIFFTLKGIVNFFNLYLAIIYQQLFVKKLRYTYVDGLSNYQYKSFVNSDAGKIQNTMSGEVVRISAAFASYFGTVRAWFMVFVYLFLAFKTNAQFAILVSIGGVFSNFLFRIIYKKTKEASANITKGGHAYQRLLLQKVNHFKYLKATGTLRTYGNHLKKAIDYIETQNKKIGLLNSIVGSTREPLIILVVVAVILVQVEFFSEGLGGIIISLLFFYRALNYVVNLQFTWNQFLNVSGSLVNMKEFTAKLNSDKESYGSQSFESLNTSITLSGVELYFESKHALAGIDLEVNKNQTIAFVGESGSGKTTLVNIIAGLFNLDSGNIKIDNKFYTDLDIRTVQSRIGYVTQEPVILSDSIFDNITLWSEKTSQNLERFWKITEEAALFDFINELPEKENTLLGNNGIQLSGGQKQRLSIARELFKNIDILILDEATSALDSETERIIQKNIDKLKGKLTILIVAHRLSTIKNVDCIYLLEKGKVLSSGNYKILKDQSPEFRRMTELQEI